MLGSSISPGGLSVDFKMFVLTSISFVKRTTASFCLLVFPNKSSYFTSPMAISSVRYSALIFIHSNMCFFIIFVLAFKWTWDNIPIHVAEVSL